MIYQKTLKFPSAGVLLTVVLNGKCWYSDVTKGRQHYLTQQTSRKMSVEVRGVFMLKLILKNEAVDCIGQLQHCAKKTEYCFA